MPVPLLDLKPQNLALEPELKSAFDRVLRSGQFILGAEVDSFEKQIAQWIGAPFAIGVSSGTDALLLALMSLDIGPGDEVICPAFTFFATAGCIARVGATPVFADACPDSFNLNVADAARRITPRTKAIIPVHLFGQMTDLDTLLELAQNHHLAVIEDAAQSLGATFRGRPAGTLGAFGAFSFFPSKNLGAFGDAGLLITQDADLAEKARILRVHGAHPKYVHRFIGANFRIDALQAALLAVKLPHYNHYTARRQFNAAYYHQHLERILPQSNPPIILPPDNPHGRHIWNQYTLRVPGVGRRDALRAFLAARQIGTEIYYPIPLHRQECFARFLPQPRTLPVAESLAQQCLSLPIYPELTTSQLDEVISAIHDWMQIQPAKTS